MDRNTTSVQTGKDCAPGKNSMELPAGRRFSSTVKNLCEIRTVYLNTATKKVAASLILNENVSETLCIFSIEKTNCCRIK